jgi:hypothetical protein
MADEKPDTKPSADNLDVVETKLSKVDKILTHLKIILKKHWGIILLLLFVGFIYWAFTLPPVQETPANKSKTFDSAVVESSSQISNKVVNSDYVDYVQDGIVFKMDSNKYLYYEVDGALYAVYKDETQQAYFYYDINGQAQWCQ